MCGKSTLSLILLLFLALPATAKSEAIAILRMPRPEACGPSSPYGYSCITISPDVPYTGLYQSWGVTADCKPRRLEVSITSQLYGHLQFWHYARKFQLPKSYGNCSGVVVPVDCLGIRWNHTSDISDSEWFTIAIEDKDPYGDVLMSTIKGVNVQSGDTRLPSNTLCPSQVLGDVEAKEPQE